MPYICIVCTKLWPCTVVAHNEIWSNKHWYPEGHHHTIACFVFDHEACTRPEHCACQCHREKLDEPASVSVPPTNR